MTDGGQFMAQGNDCNIHLDFNQQKIENQYKTVIIHELSYE